MYNILSSIKTFLANPNNANYFLVFVTFLLVLATIGLVLATLALKKTANMQFLGSMGVAFQNEWHEKEQWSMRLYLYSPDFENTFDKAINTIYKDRITHKSTVYELSSANNLRSPKTAQTRITFNANLSSIVMGTFTPFEALNRVMLSLDRILFLNNNRFFRREFIEKYNRSVKNMKRFLEPYIVIERLLRDNEGNFKEELLKFLKS